LLYTITEKQRREVASGVNVDPMVVRRLKLSMSYGAYAVVMLCVLFVLLIACVAQCFVTDDRDGMFGNVLTPNPHICCVELYAA